MGGGTPDQFAQGAEKLTAQWKEKGRTGEPRKVTLAYFALGETAEEDARSELGHYYAWLGDELAGQIVARAANYEQTVTTYIQAFADAGADELILFPCSTDVEQVDMLAEAVL